jgi:pantoate--beta-alanine ligase
MYIFKKVEDLQNYLNQLRETGKSIGFVPTMGALHAGHISLVEQANQGSDITVCSIFVNPTQFDNADDLKKYARNLPKDAKMLGDAFTNVLFAPNIDEVLTKVMEGRFRTGLFEGMVQVVNRLLNIVDPDCLYMGQKDFQQAAIIKNMLEQQKRRTQLVVCPIIREPHGLAMSSRNERLSTEDRALAKVLHEALLDAKQNLAHQDIATLKKTAQEKITHAGLKLDYFEIADASSLLSIEHTDQSTEIVACVAAYLKDVRLIDNMILN